MASDAMTLRESLGGMVEILSYEQGQRSPLQLKIYKVFRSAGVEMSLASVILINLVIIVIETDREADGLESLTGLGILNTVILAIYTIEVLCKGFLYRCHFFLDPWLMMDFMVVFLEYILIVIDAVSDHGMSLGFLRALRLLRLARSGRVLHFTPQLALMVKGLYGTLKVVACGVLLLTGALIILGTMAVQLAHPVNQRVAQKGVYDGCERCPRAFASTFNACVTFSQQIIFGDSWGTVSIPIIEEEPAIFVFFAIAFLCTNLMILNVILSLVVDSSLKAADEDAKAVLRQKWVEYKKHEAEFRMICEELDKDGSGSICRAELLRGFDKHPRFKELMDLMEFTREDCDAVFNILDTDGSGDVAYEEFIGELHKMKSHDSHTMLVFIKYYVSELKTLMSEVVENEFTQLHRVLGVVPADRIADDVHAWSRSKHELENVLTRDSVYEVMQQIRVVVCEKVERSVEDLARQIEEHTHMLRALQVEHHAPFPTKLQRETFNCVRGNPALLPPRVLPEPPLEEVKALGEIMRFPTACTKGACNIGNNALGPLRHDVGRGRSEANAA